MKNKNKHNLSPSLWSSHKHKKVSVPKQTLWNQNSEPFSIQEQQIKRNNLPCPTFISEGCRPKPQQLSLKLPVYGATKLEGTDSTSNKVLMYTKEGSCHDEAALISCWLCCQNSSCLLMQN